MGRKELIQVNLCYHNFPDQNIRNGIVLTVTIWRTYILLETSKSGLGNSTRMSRFEVNRMRYSWIAEPNKVYRCWPTRSVFENTWESCSSGRSPVKAKSRQQYSWRQYLQKLYRILYFAYGTGKMKLESVVSGYMLRNALPSHGVKIRWKLQSICSLRLTWHT